MMDCKRALQDANGDLEAAQKLLRERGMASAAKRAGRETPEGKVGYRVAEDAKRGVIVAVGCETEPVSNTEEFLAFAKKVLEAVERDGPGAEEQLDEERQELSGKLGENIVVVGGTRFEAVDGATIDGYAHPPANKLGVLLQVRGGANGLARKVAMHIAASAPRWIGREAIADEIVGVQQRGVELAIVVGGGNIFRGLEAAAEGMDRATADYAGMLATLLNALPLQDALESRGAHTRVLSALAVAEVAEPYIRRRAIRHLEKRRIVIFAAGTGNPFFTTDTAAALRTPEIGPDGILMAKNKVQGVLDGDPRSDPNAQLLPEITHLQAIERGLKVMDTTALSLCMDNRLTIYVFALEPGNIRKVVEGERVGTIVSTP